MIPALDIKELSYAYEKTGILNELSFEVPEGRMFILIGPNGSGKTTLMKLLAGIFKPDRGRLKLFGKSSASFSTKALARLIAFVPQQMPDSFPFSVRETVLMGRSPYLGMLGIPGKKDDEIARNAMQFTNITHLADRTLSRLSGGELQRTFIARALCQEPKIILLDEPTAFLDMAHQIRLMDLLEQLKEEKGMTIVMVSHDINLAAMYADLLLLMKAGRIIRLGTPEAVLTYSALEEAYGCPLLVDKSPLGDYSRITLVPGRYQGQCR